MVVLRRVNSIEDEIEMCVLYVSGTVIMFQEQLSWSDHFQFCRSVPDPDQRY